MPLRRGSAHSVCWARIVSMNIDEGIIFFRFSFFCLRIWRYLDVPRIGVRRMVGAQSFHGSAVRVRTAEVGAHECHVLFILWPFQLCSCSVPAPAKVHCGTLWNWIVVMWTPCPDARCVTRSWKQRRGCFACSFGCWRRCATWICGLLLGFGSFLLGLRVCCFCFCFSVSWWA